MKMQMYLRVMKSPMFECSECGEWKEYDTDFCPDCGAIIDEEME